MWLAVDYSCGADGFVLSDWPDHAWRLHIPRFPSFSCLLTPLAPCIHKHWHVYASVCSESLSHVFVMFFLCVYCCCSVLVPWSVSNCASASSFWYLSKLVSCCFAGFTSSFDSAYQAFYSMAIMAEAVHNPIVSMCDWILYARLLSWLLIGLDAFARSLFLSRFSVRSAGTGCLAWCRCGAGMVLVRLSAAVLLHVSTSFVQLCKAQCCGGKSRFWALR